MVSWSPSMHARLALILSALLVSAAVAPAASAEWIWSPQTGWIGPGGAVKDTPGEQLAWAEAFFNRQDYKRARAEFQKLLKVYRDSPEAPEAQFLLSRTYEEEGDYYKAFKEYRKTLQVYPSTKRFEEILEREYQIGNYFMAGKKRKVFGVAAILPARDKAIEIFQAIVDDGPFSEHGQLAQYKLGLAHLALGDYEPAVTAFEGVVSKFPDSPLVDDARYQIAQASLKGTFRAGYDQSPTDMAMRELDSFVKEYPDSELTSEASTKLGDLKERRAEHEYLVAQFYERRKHPTSAVPYYETIVRQFGQTSWAPKAAERLHILQSSL
jgi:outer membrane assembly lipoprotein YfiO